jgi:hypothetical protein
MHRFLDKDIAAIEDSTTFLTKRCERTLQPQLSPVTLAVPECEVAFRAAREVASRLRFEEGGQRPVAIVLGGVAGTVASGCARFRAVVEAAGTLGAIEGTEWA